MTMSCNQRCLSLVLVMISLFAAGCWDAKDVNQRSFVMGVAFDLSDTDEKIMMTIEIPILTSFASQSQSPQDAKSLLASTTGTSVAQMAARFETRTWRELFFGHTQCIIVSEDLARESILPIIDFFDRNPRIDRRLHSLSLRVKPMKFSTPRILSNPWFPSAESDVEYPDQYHQGCQAQLPGQSP